MRKSHEGQGHRRPNMSIMRQEHLEIAKWLEPLHQEVKENNRSPMETAKCW